MRSFGVILVLSVTLLLSCDEEDDWWDRGSYVEFWSDSDWVNDSDVDTLFIGDTLSFTFYHYGRKKPKYIDVTLSRNGSDGFINTEEILVYESFYPQSKNGIYDVSWLIDESIFPTPEGYADRLGLSTGSFGSSGSWQPRIVIMEKE